LDIINELYEEVFGHPKFPHWLPFNDVAILLQSVYGIVPLTAPTSSENPEDLVEPAAKFTDSLRYLAIHQGTSVPYTPVKTKEEKMLFTQLIQEVLRKDLSMLASSTFEEMEKSWKGFAKGTNDI
jgi:hypothetical protein